MGSATAAAGDALLARSFAILRGYAADESAALAAMLWEAGVRNVEVPTLTEQAWTAFDAVARAAGDGRRAGIGSARGRADLERAQALGASFAVSAGLVDELVDGARATGLELIPGVLTPSEVLRAVAAGCTTVKLFPAATVGPSHVAALRAPFPDVGFVVVGGVGPDNAGAFVRAGAVGIGIGSALLPPPGFGPAQLEASRRTLEALAVRLAAPLDGADSNSQPKGR